MPTESPYAELIEISTLAGIPRVRYVRMFGLLRRICLAESAQFKSDYATLFSRLLAVCRHHAIDHRPADRFRRHARRVLHEDFCPTPEAERFDLADLTHFVWQITAEPIPASLPREIRPIRPAQSTHPAKRTLRGVVERIVSPHCFRCQVEGEALPFDVHFLELPDAAEDRRLTTRYLAEGDNVMLLDAVAVEGAALTLEVEMVILEPDYLLDVTALTACLKPYGHSPLNFLLGLFLPAEPTKHILLGNLANQFMDDCIYAGPSASFEHSVRRHFRADLLAYACMPASEIGPGFLGEARRQFNHIREAVLHRFSGADVGIDPAEAQLEPSFLCPTLGLRGRLDVMTTDRRRVLELKSGKAETFGREKPAAKADHLMQMSLYGEMLRRNFGMEWGEVQTYLFYSAYPIFFNERRSAAALREVMDLRNGIVCLLRRLALGQADRILPLLTPEHLNVFGMEGNFFNNYLKPQIEAVTRPLSLLASDPLLHDYFTAYLSFILSELFLNKTSDNRPDSLRGFAATWTADPQTKRLAGNLLSDLRIVEMLSDAQGAVAALRFLLPEAAESDFVPNFSEGEMVQIYEATSPQANVTNRQLFRATVAHISGTELLVELAFPQRNPALFRTEARYAVEHDSTDGPSNQQVRNLFSLLTATPLRRDLLLARRAPDADPQRKLLSQPPVTVAPLIEAAKQARDFYLLVGPPGTGKTNVALRAMVTEFLLEKAAQPAEERPHALLLTAYTNRAVDEICSMLSHLAEEIPFDYLRLGHPASCAPDHRGHLLSVRAEGLRNRAEARRLIEEVPIVVGTVVTLTNQRLLFSVKHFSEAIIDEASQLLEPQLLGLLCAQVHGEDAIDKFILIGDHKQLPAVVQLPASRTQPESAALRALCLDDLRQSFFERLHRLEQRAGRTAFVGLLHRQGRMHPAICDFPNRRFYGGRLEAVGLPHQCRPLSYPTPQSPLQRFVASTRMGFLPVCPVGPRENVRANEVEATRVAELIAAIVSLHAGEPDFDAARRVGVIVPFRSQIACVRTALRHSSMHALAACADTMTIDTVECYQGSQRDFIIFSATVCLPYQLSLLSEPQEVDGAQVDRKLNVAITRAREQFFLIGNPHLLRQSPIYAALIDACLLYEPDPH